MRDPHVESLHYKLVPDETTTFSPRAAPVEASTPAFTARLADGALTIEMQEHHPSEAPARGAVEPFLRAWEIRHALSVGGHEEFAFEFDRSEIIDRDPPPPGAPRTFELSADVGTYVIVGANTTGSVERGSYPAAPADFTLDPDAATLWQRWQGYVAGREPLQPMAYFCLTVLEAHGGRAAASARYGISQRVLSTIGRLATETGDLTTARKATGGMTPATPNETQWLEAVVQRLVLRSGEVAADPSAAAATIDMGDLPSL